MRSCERRRAALYYWRQTQSHPMFGLAGHVNEETCDRKAKDEGGVGGRRGSPCYIRFMDSKFAKSNKASCFLPFFLSLIYIDCAFLRFAIFILFSALSVFSSFSLFLVLFHSYLSFILLFLLYTVHSSHLIFYTLLIYFYFFL